MTVLRRPPTWDESKKQLGDPSFMSKLLEYDKDKLDDGLLKKIGKFTVESAWVSGEAHCRGKVITPSSFLTLT